MAKTEEKCKECGCKHTDKNPLKLDVDPFTFEMANDNRKHWFCKRCYAQLAGDI